MSLLGDNSFIEIFYLSSLCHRTKQLLTEYLARGGRLPNEGIEYLATFTLSHIDDMQQGFKWTLRATEADVDELQYLLRKADVFDWSNPDEEETPKSRKPIPPDLRKIQALQHAKVVLSLIPWMPKGAVTYPRRKSYADIPRPSSPAELAERIDELERMIWDTATQLALEQLNENSYRRAYGFFDTASWLAVQHMRMFRKDNTEGPSDSKPQPPN